MKKTLFLFLSVLLFLSAQSQTDHKIEGYTQIRSEYQNGQTPYLYIRRAKFWYSAKRTFKNQSYLKFKVKVNYGTKHHEFELLDFKTTYHKNHSEINFGQFVPDFGLQRSQSDQYLAVLERSLVINSLIPAAQTDARDIGIQYTYDFDSLKSRLSIGFFNGTGANTLNYSQNSFLVTSRFSYFFIKNKNFRMAIGGSGMFRKIQNADFSKFYFQDSLFSGNDFRYGAEMIFYLKNFHFQTEFIQAKLDNDIAQGFYAMTDYTLNKNQFAVSYENLLNVEKNYSERILVEYSYLFDNDDIKLSFGTYYFPDLAEKYMLILQFQYIFPTFEKK